MDRRLELRLEPLEQRLLLNAVGNVLAGVVGGNLVIVGDEWNNAIEIWRDGDSIVVMGTEGTAVNGVPDGTFVAPLPLGSININMNEGHDDVDISGLGFGGSINYEGGTGNDRFRLRSSGILGSVNVLAGFDHDKVWIEDVGVAGSLNIGTGWGEDGVTVLQTAVGGSLSVASAGNELGVTFDDGIGVRGNVTVQGTNSAMNGFLDEMSIGGSLFVGADGPLSLRIEDSGVRNGVTVMGGRWDTMVSIAGIGTTNLTIGTGTALPGEMPELAVEVVDVGLAGSLSITGGPGFVSGMIGSAPGISVRNAGVRGTVDVAWLDADGGEIDVYLDVVAAGGSVSVSGNRGQFDVGLFEVATGGSITVTGNFLTEVETLWLAARGDFNLDFGPGVLALLLDDGTFGGDINVTGSGSGGIEYMWLFYNAVRGNVNINTGDGSVTAWIDKMRIGGSVNINNGAGAYAGYVVEDTGIGGSVNLQSNALVTEAIFDEIGVRGNLNVQTGIGGDRVLIDDSLIAGRTQVNTDGGQDFIDLEDSYFAGRVSLLAGTGNDEVTVEHSGESGSAPVIFASSLLVDMGDGDDEAALGLNYDSNNTVGFGGSVTLRGGPGYDELYLASQNGYTTVPSLTGWESWFFGS